MRKSIQITTYNILKNFFRENSKKDYAVTFLRDSLKIDYYSVKLGLKLLSEEKFIKETNQRWKLA